MNNVNQIAEFVAANSNISKVAATNVVKDVFLFIRDALDSGEVVSVAGFGKFEATYRPGRTGRNPQTGEELEIAGRNVPKFKPSADLKRYINNHGAE